MTQRFKTPRFKTRNFNTQNSGAPFFALPALTFSILAPALAVSALSVPALSVLALSVLTPAPALAGERGGALFAAPAPQPPSFGYESRVSAARQPAFAPQFSQGISQEPKHSASDAGGSAAPEGRLRLRNMAWQGGY